MKNIIVALAVICFATPAIAKDSKMTCAELQVEIEELNGIQTAAGNADTNKAIASAGAAAATQTAIMSGAGSSIPFIGGLANIATTAVNSSAERSKKAAANAEKRLIKLETIAEMKDCYE